MGHLLLTVGLGPLLFVQGLWARKKTPRLPEAAGPRSGVIGDGEQLRLLVLGDSAAAGVGAAHQDQALAGRLVKALSLRYRVEWRLIATTGATTASTLERLDMVGTSRFDVAVTSLGVNDVVAGRGLGTWRRQQRRLRYVLRQSFGARQLVISGLPPVRGFPALPQPLRWYLGRRAMQFDAALARDVESEGDVSFVGLDLMTDASLMAEDGYHPGPEVYRAWADRVAAVVS